MDTPESGRETEAFLTMAQSVREAVAQRDLSVRPYLERYERAEHDPRVKPERRVQRAHELFHAARRADHHYQDCLDEAFARYGVSLQREHATP